MKNDQWFFINDFDEFVDHSRSLVFKFFGAVNEIADDSMTASLYEMTQKETEEMDQTLTHDEAAAIIKNYAKKQINRKTKHINVHP